MCPLTRTMFMQWNPLWSTLMKPQTIVITACVAFAMSITPLSIAHAREKPNSETPPAEAPLAEVTPAEAGVLDGKPAEVAPAEADVLVGVWPEVVPKITLDLDDASLDEAIEEIAEKAGWSLVLTVSDDLEGSLTLRVKDVPATEALRIVLEKTNLQGRLDRGMLVVDLPSDESGVQSHRKRDKRDKRRGKDIKLSVGYDDGAVHIQDGDERTNVGGNVRVEANEVIEGDAVAVGGSVTILGTVEGDAVAIGGSVILEPGAIVEGEATAIGGEVLVPEGAQVHGDRVSIGGGSIADVIQAIAKHEKPIALGGLLFSVLATFLRAMTFLVLALLLVAFVPERVEKVSSFLRERSGRSALAGLALMLGILPLCVLLAVTVVGLALIPVVLLLLAIAIVLGMTAFCQWLGYRIPVLGNKGPVGAVLVGLALITLVDLLPFLGTPVVAIISFVAAGAVVLSRFGKLKAEPAPPPNVL